MTMTTHASRYFTPRPAVDSPRPAPLEPSRRATFLERNGEVIAGAIGLVVFGFALGIVAVGAIALIVWG